MIKKSPFSVLNEENFSKSNEDLLRSRASLNVLVYRSVSALRLKLEFMCLSDALEIQGEAFQPPFTA